MKNLEAIQTKLNSIILSMKMLIDILEEKLETITNAHDKVHTHFLK